MNVPKVSIVARLSGTGKTRVMEALIAELTRRGWKVGAVKNAPKMQLDHEGKDSWRFEQAGAGSLVIIGPDKYALLRRTPQPLEPQAAASLLEDVDIVLVEGYKLGPLPKIEVVRREKGEDIISPPGDLVAVVTDIFGLTAPAPCFTFEQTPELADLLEEKFLHSRNNSAERPVLTHFDQGGRARMVDVTAKDVTAREAAAGGEIRMAPATLEMIKQGRMAKGDVLAVAQVAAIMGVKETGRLIPMCHPLPIGGVNVDFRLAEEESKLEVIVKVKTTSQTGVEMEALTGVNIALLTVYDMCKAIDKNMVLENIRLLEKIGGKSGHYRRAGEERWEK